MIDTVGTRHEDPAAVRGREASRQQFPSEPVLHTDTSTQQSPRNSNSGRSPSTAGQQPADAAADADAGRGGDSSHNSVDELLRRIARDASARRAREDKSNARQADDRGNHDSGGRTDRQERRHQERRSRQEGKSSHASTRKSRWNTTSERRHSSGREDYGGSSRVHGHAAGGDGAEREKTHFGTAAAEAAAVAAAADQVSVAEANPFTEGMWEDASCRQVLQAMFFPPGSALPAGSTEEYKELEGTGCDLDYS